MNANAEAHWEQGGAVITEHGQSARAAERRPNDARERAQSKAANGEDRFSPDPLQPTDRYRLVTPYSRI